jgi:uncharacterized membrane protein
VNVTSHKLQWINDCKSKDEMYPSDEKLRINNYGTIILGFVTKPNRNNKAILKIELNKLSVNNKHKNQW